MRIIRKSPNINTKLRRFNRGFTLIEVLVTMAILAVVGSIAAVSFVKINEKNRQQAVEYESGIIFSSLLEIVEELHFGKIYQFQNKSYFLTYPIRAISPSVSGEYVDDFMFPVLQVSFFRFFFERNPHLKGGLFRYNKPTYTMEQNTCETSIIYTLPSGVKLTFLVSMRNANLQNYDSLIIRGMKYEDGKGHSKTHYL